MKLKEHEGIDLFSRYGIAVPDCELATEPTHQTSLPCPLVLKAQVLKGDRGRTGGVVFVDEATELTPALTMMLKGDVQGEPIESVLLVPKLSIVKEYYVSLSYDTNSRQPVLALNTKGGSGTDSGALFQIDLTEGLLAYRIREHILEAGFPQEEVNKLADVVSKLWKLFIEEYARLAEINPLVVTDEGSLIAADAKVVIDDEKERPQDGALIPMGGDIAVLASGGGASLLLLDALVKAGGKPANYTEYSGNPPREYVARVTEKVLSQPNIRGCWVAGGTANFTDIFETLSGFVDGLRHVEPKPTYPIVIRRDGPRVKEAFAMLKEVGEKEGYDFHLYGGETPMIVTAPMVVEKVNQANQ